MNEKTWPTHMKKLIKDNTMTAYAHNRKEEQALAEEGWVDQVTYANASKDKSRLLYHPDGRTAASMNDEDEATLSAQGFGRTPVAKKQPRVAAAASKEEVESGNVRVDALEESVGALSEDVAGMKSDIAQILAALTEKKHKKE